MGLNIARGNMYPFVTHTWNTIKGKCPHDCSYCYMKRFPQKQVRFDDKELKTDLGSGNFIFVGSSCDMWAIEVSPSMIARTLEKCALHENKYLFQTKNPVRFINWEQRIPDQSVLCTTIETDRFYKEQGNAPSIHSRERAMIYLKDSGFRLFITIEPIMDFDVLSLIKIIHNIKPEQVNIGADSGNNNLPEPGADKVLSLISELSKFTKVFQKPNLKRITG